MATDPKKATAKKQVAGKDQKKKADITLPIELQEGMFFGAVFPAPKNELLGIIPHEDLSIVEIFPGWGAVAFACFDFTKTSVGPYREFVVAIPVRHKPIIDIPLAPLFMEDKFKDYGTWIHIMPNDRQETVDNGVKYWGYNKFPADLAIDIEDEDLVGTLDENGENIFTLRVNISGMKLKPARSEMSTYSVKNSDLLRTTIPFEGEGAFAGAINRVSLRLGEHRLGRELAAAGVRPEFPIQRRYFTTWSGLLPEAQMTIRG